MRVVRTILRLVLLFALLAWSAGFVMGRSKPLSWEIAGYAVYVAAGAAALLVLTLPFGFSHPTSSSETGQRTVRVTEDLAPGTRSRRSRRRSGGRSRRKETPEPSGPRSCLDCGRPAISGSDYCRYHTDLRREESQRGRR